MTETPTRSYTSFDGHNRIASGSLQVNALAAKRAVESRSPNPVLTFDDQTGRCVDIDIRGSDEEVLERLSLREQPSEGAESESGDVGASSGSRGRGRPRLGVVAREVTLLPRHWDWLGEQPGGASVTLRKLIDDARRTSVDRDLRRKAQERAYHFSSAMAGDCVGFEEAARALFAGDAVRFNELTEAWPADVRDHARDMAFGGNLNATSDRS